MQRLAKNLQRDADDAKADFQAEENRLLGGIMSKMQAVLTKYANDNQITMIVDISPQPNNLLVCGSVGEYYRCHDCPLR